MSGTNEFKLFCSGEPGVADSLSPADYAALTTILSGGFQTGEASSEQANTVWRQCSSAAAAIGEIVARSGQNALDDRDPIALASKLIAALATLLPSAHTPGDIKVAAYNAFTADWVICDGSSFLRSSFSALFNAIGTTFGAVDANHFNVPDLRGVFVRGYDAGRGVDPGRVFGTYQADAMPSHVHSVNLQPLNSADAGGAGKVATGNNAPEGVIPPFNTAAAGVGGETIVKNLALNFYIYTGV